jgi:PP-loop superfamily ATP-utilizing enzyme
VRHFGETARIEVPLDQLERLEASCARVHEALRLIGYERVEVDPRGYRVGSLNSG